MLGHNKDSLSLDTFVVVCIDSDVDSLECCLTDSLRFVVDHKPLPPDKDHGRRTDAGDGGEPEYRSLHNVFLKLFLRSLFIICCVPLFAVLSVRKKSLFSCHIAISICAKVKPEEAKTKCIFLISSGPRSSHSWEEE